MAETTALSPHHLLDDRRDAFAALPAGATITVEAGVPAAGLRVPPDRIAAAARALDLPLPEAPDTWTEAGATRAVRLGPDEWLVLGGTDAPDELEARLGQAVEPLGGSAVDVSAQRTGLRLAGRRARDVLATGCSIDLHPRVFGAGRCAQTTVGMAGVVLLALDGTGTDFLLLVRPSFGPYLAEWLVDAVAGLGES